MTVEFLVYAITAIFTYVAGKVSKHFDGTMIYLLLFKIL